MSKIQKKLALVPFLLLSGGTMAHARAEEQLFEGMSNYWVLVGALAAMLLLLFLLVLVTAFVLYGILLKHLPAAQSQEALATEGSWQWFWKQFNAAKPVAQEATIMLDHNYDGIRELDNDLPPWWKMMFYGCVAFSVFYIYIYHFTGAESAVSVEEYRAEMAYAAAAKQEYLARVANLIDESNVEMADASGISTGKELYMKNCKVCHGAEGEGGIGPNLTDAYWLHGGDLKSVFKTVKYGVPQNGMIPWNDKMTPQQMQQISSFILSLQGTNPPNAKEPQGELFVNN